MKIIRLYILLLITIMWVSSAYSQFDREWKVYLVPFSHTDVGYTATVDSVLKQHAVYLDTVISFIHQTENNAEGEQFKWTIEIPWVLEYYLDSRPASRINELMNLVRIGKIEIGAMHFGLQTDICGSEELVRSLYYSKALADKYNFTNKTLLLNDTPGFTWALAQIMAKSEIPYLSAAMNNFFSDFYATTTLPYLFNWESQEGSKTLIWRCIDKSWAYLEGAITRQVYSTYSNMQPRITNLLIQLQNEGYPYDAVYINCATGDNGAPDKRIVENVKQWNQNYSGQKLIISTAVEFFDYISANYSSQIPTFRGDGPNWWTWMFGASATREFSTARKTHNRLPSAEKFASIADLLVDSYIYPSDDLTKSYRDNLTFEDHNLGTVDNNPIGDQAFWNLKKDWVNSALNTAEEVTSSALSGISSEIKTEKAVNIAVFNPLSWERSEAVIVSDPVLTGMQDFQLIDQSTNNIVKHQLTADGEVVFLAENIPAMGYRIFNAVPVESAVFSGRSSTESFRLENNFYKIEIDNNTGGILSLYDKEMMKEFAEGDGQFNQYLLNSTFPPSGMQIVYQDSGSVLQKITLRGSAMGSNWYETEVILYNDIKRIDFINRYDRLPVTATEGVDFKFNFNLSSPVLHYEIPFGYVKLHNDELSGFRTKHYAVQHWMNVSQSNTNALLVSGNGSINAYPAGFDGTIRMLISFNNQSSQYRAGTGELEMAYSFTSYHGELDPVISHKFAKNFNNPLEGKVIEYNPDGVLESGEYSLLSVEDAALNITTVKKSNNNSGYIMRLYNPADEDITAKIKFSSQVYTAYETTLLEDVKHSIPVADSSLSINFNKHEIKTIRVHFDEFSNVKDESLPAEFALYQNYPNPFNPETKIKFRIGHSQVSIKIFDLLGREIRTLFNEEKPAGEYEISFNAEGLSSGVYFIKLEAGQFVSTKKMVLVK
jgi:hypothetical protein